MGSAAEGHDPLARSKSRDRVRTTRPRLGFHELAVRNREDLDMGHGVTPWSADRSHHRPGRRHLETNLADVARGRHAESSGRERNDPRLLEFPIMNAGAVVPGTRERDVDSTV